MKLQLEFIQNETRSLKWNVKKASFNPSLKDMFLKNNGFKTRENCFAVQMLK